MHARVTTFRTRSGMEEQAVHAFQGMTGEVEALAGFRRAVLLLDRGSRQGMTITFWEDEAAVTASAEAAGQVFQRAAEYVEGAPERHHYEVAIDTDQG